MSEPRPFPTIALLLDGEPLAISPEETNELRMALNERYTRVGALLASECAPEALDCERRHASASLQRLVHIFASGSPPRDTDGLAAWRLRATQLVLRRLRALRRTLFARRFNAARDVEPSEQLHSGAHSPQHSDPAH